MSNPVAFVTGGAGNIGQSTCIKLAERGVNIAVVDKDEEAGSALAARLVSEYKINADFMNIDLLDPNSFQAVHNQIEGRFGRLDYLINNAAFYDDTPGWGVPFEEESYEAWEKVMKVNLLAPFFLVQKLTPLLNKSDSAAIVNVSSIYGMVGPDHNLYEGLNMTNPAAYAASKGGLTQVTKWLSTVLAPSIRVNTVTPGGIERGQDPIFIKRYKKRTPLGRMSCNEDIASAINFLLSDQATYITGQNLVVDGGWTAW